MISNLFKSIVITLTLISSLIVNSNVFAGDSAPVTLLKESTIEMLATLKSHQGTLKSNPKYLEAQIRRIVVPKFDVTSMAQSVIGRRHWEASSPAVQQAFIREFTDLVINVYSAPLQDYNGDKVEFLPLRESIENQSRVAVQTIIIRPTGQRIAVNYSLKKIGDAWKVYDFSIEGISMVASYRSQFAEVLEAKGLSGLLAQIRSHSRTVS